MSSWVAVVRLAVVMAIPLGAIVLALWLAPVDLTVGPLHVRPACQVSNRGADDGCRVDHHWASDQH
jgi:hypothetical protein